jgi:hypothetical protein
MAGTRDVLNSIFELSFENSALLLKLYDESRSFFVINKMYYFIIEFVKFYIINNYNFC